VVLTDTWWRDAPERRAKLRERLEKMSPAELRAWRRERTDREKANVIIHR